MTWQDRTDGGRKRSILIDEVTKDWRVLNGKLQFDSTSVSQVYHTVMTARGTVVHAPQYGSRIHEQWKVSAVLPRQLEDDIRASLQPLVDTGVIKSGSISVEVTPYGGHIAQVVVKWTDGGGERRGVTVPLQPGVID